MASVVINKNSFESLQDEKKIYVGRVKLSKDFNIINYFKKYAKRLSSFKWKW